MTVAREQVVGEAGTLIEFPANSNGVSPFRAAQESELNAYAVGATQSDTPRQTDDEINRFLLCVLVGKSAKQLKDTAQNAGERLPITDIVRSLVRSYCRAEKETPGLLGGPDLHLGRLRKLNRNVLNEQIKSSVRKRVRESEVRLERANRLGDETRIRAEKETLARDIADRDRLVSEFV